MKKRSKIQWMFYLRENFWKFSPQKIKKLKIKKWQDLSIRFLRELKNPKNYNILLKKRLTKRRRYFKTFLQQKHRFMLFYGIQKEKKFKKLIRLSFNCTKKKTVFHKLLNNRLDSILVSSGFIKTIELAHILLKSHLIVINDNPITQCDYYVRPGDVVAFDSRIHKYIYENINFNYNVPSIFEISYTSLEFMIHSDKKHVASLESLKIPLDIVQRYYRR